MEREAGKDLFRFLREGDGDSGASLYYRWRTYAFVMGNMSRHCLPSRALVYIAASAVLLGGSHLCVFVVVLS